METLRPLGKGDTGNVLKMRELLNALVYNVNKLKGDTDGDGLGENIIPENVYPVADGEGGFLAGDLKKVVTPGGPNISLCPPDQYGPDLSFQYITTGEYNYGIGNNIFISLTTGSSNTAFGLSCLNSLVSGRSNSAYGTNALTGLMDGDFNSGVGHAAGGNRHHGNYNSYLGAYAGFTVVEDSITNSTAIGSHSNLTKNNQVVLGDDAIVGLITRGVHINTRTVTTKDATATLTSAEMLAGVLKTTATAAVALTTPTATAIMAELNGGGIGTTFELILDNSASTAGGAVTLTLDASITNQSGTAGDLVVAVGKVRKFELYFTSPTTAIIIKLW